MTSPFPASTVQFNSGLPVWLVAVLAVAAFVSSIFFYRRQTSAAGTGAVHVLTLLRLLAISLAAMMLLAPSRVWSFQHRSRGPLYLVLDDTRSMSRVDPPQSKSRAALAEDALRQLRPTLDRFDVTLVPISRRKSIIPPADRWFDTAIGILRGAQSATSPLGKSLEHIAQDSETPSTLLLLSDGRQNHGPLAEPAARRLASRGSRLFALSVGSPSPVRDAAVDAIDAPSFVLAGDDLTVSATVRLDAITDPVMGKLSRDGNRIATKTISPAPNARVEFTDAAPPVGDHIYAVSIDPVPEEATLRNNQLTMQVSVRRDKIRVLLIESEPRWEFQFLKTLLQVDRTVDLTTRLIQHARIENIPSPPPNPLPATAQAWSAFDVVILGDVSPATLAPAIQSELAAALRQGKPKSLILIAGPRNMPTRYAASPLAALLPVDLTVSSTTTPDPAEGFAPRFNPDAQDSTLARLFPDDQQNRTFWSAVPPFFWHDPHTTLKPAARILWEIAGDSPAQPPVALLSEMQYGPSRILFLATPETWRLRYVQAPTGQVADLHRRFWSQALRWSIAGDSATTDTHDRDVEDLNQSADPALLAALAKTGNGASFDVSDAAKLAAALSTTEHVQARTTRLGLFDDPSKPSTRYLHWALYVIFIAVISTEWIVRKRRGLV